MRGNTFQGALDAELYSASVVESAVSLCSFEDHMTGQPAYMMMKPDRDFEVVGS